MDPRYSNYPRTGAVQFGQRPPGAHFDFISEAFNIIRADLGTWIASSFLTLAITYAVSIPLSFAGNMLIFGSLTGASTTAQVFNPLGIVFQILSSAIVYALTLVLLVGQGMMGLKAARGERVQIGEMFAGFRLFVPVFLVSLIVALLVFVGLVLLIVPGVIAAGLFVMAPFAAYEQRLSPGDALKWSLETCKPYFWGIAGIGFCASFVSGIGILLCCVGYLFTQPIFGIVLGLTYGTFRGPVATPFMPYPSAGPIAPSESVPPYNPEPPPSPGQ